MHAPPDSIMILNGFRARREPELRPSILYITGSTGRFPRRARLCQRKAILKVGSSGLTEWRGRGKTPISPPLPVTSTKNINSVDHFFFFWRRGGGAKYAPLSPPQP